MHAAAFRRRHCNAVGLRLELNGLGGQKGVRKHDVARVGPAQSDAQSVDERDFRARVRSLHDLQHQIHSLSLPSGWMLISALSSWNDSTGSS